MPGQIRTQQFIRQVPFVPGGIQTVELPRMADLESLFLNLQGTFTYPAGAAGSHVSIGAASLIQRVELVADGKITIASVPGWALNLKSDRRYATANPSTVYNFVTAVAAGAAATVQYFGVLDQAQYDGIRPKDSNLRTSQYSILELRVTFAPWAALFTNTASVPTVFNLSFSVDGNFTTEVDPAASRPKFAIKRNTIIIDAANSNTSYPVNLPAGNAIRSVKLFTHAAGVASDAILNNVRLQNGIDVRVNSSGRALRQREAAYRDVQAGFYEIDLARQQQDGVLSSNSWFVPSPSQPVMELDFVGVANGKIEIVIQEYVGL